ncbi:serine hydrolase [Shewanella sp. JM162201]|uniref:Serine hydrolase n=1 Tax=Shewanella jiangmenensis TaxID=2837387 RepID=A0ABS5V2B6_9GAMM|nr:serine hydrolase domain-containing protein [Shewanella jiangmenensis]MBT1444603.1 serine hydrolase [Shewanella jiangmenensis]
MLLNTDALAQQSLAESLNQWRDLRLSPSFSGVILVRKNETDLLTFSAGDTVTKDSRFMLGSISKPVFASWYLSAHASDLDTPLAAKQLPDFAHKSGRALTPRMMLSHTSGINRRGNGISSNPQNANGSLPFEYSNANYQILVQSLFAPEPKNIGAALSAFFASHKLDIVAKTGGFTELYLGIQGMAPAFDETPDTTQNSHTKNLHTKNLHAINLHTKVSPEGKQRHAAYPHSTPLSLASGTLIGSAAAVADFQTALHQGKLISDVAYRAMVTPYSQREHRWGPLGYGLGLQIANKPLEYSHGGYLPGFMSLMLYYPDSGLQLVMLENVSADLSDQRKAFAHQDELRSLLRDYLNAN